MIKNYTAWINADNFFNNQKLTLKSNTVYYYQNNYFLLNKDYSLQKLVKVHYNKESLAFQVKIINEIKTLKKQKINRELLTVLLEKKNKLIVLNHI